MYKVMVSSNSATTTQDEYDIRSALKRVFDIASYPENGYVIHIYWYSDIDPIDIKLVYSFIRLDTTSGDLYRVYDIKRNKEAIVTTYAELLVFTNQLQYSYQLIKKSEYDVITTDYDPNKDYTLTLYDKATKINDFSINEEDIDEKFVVMLHIGDESYYYGVLEKEDNGYVLSDVHSYDFIDIHHEGYMIRNMYICLNPQIIKKGEEIE